MLRAGWHEECSVPLATLVRGPSSGSCSPFFYPLLNKLTSTSNTSSCVKVAWCWPSWFFGAAAMPVARDGGDTACCVFCRSRDILFLLSPEYVEQSSLAQGSDFCLSGTVRAAAHFSKHFTRFAGFVTCSGVKFQNAGGDHSPRYAHLYCPPEPSSLGVGFFKS